MQSSEIAIRSSPPGSVSYPFQHYLVWLQFFRSLLLRKSKNLSQLIT